jgi:hypothetical protein
MHSLYTFARAKKELWVGSDWREGGREGGRGLAGSLARPDTGTAFIPHPHPHPPTPAPAPRPLGAEGRRRAHYHSRFCSSWGRSNCSLGPAPGAPPMGMAAHVSGANRSLPLPGVMVAVGRKAGILAEAPGKCGST